MILSSQLEDFNNDHHHHHNTSLTNNNNVNRSKIVDFYNNRSILITGGSGFIGKVLIEKLLRSCPDIKRIFVLIRPKYNKEPQERLNELLKLPLFDKLRENNDNSLLKKIIVVQGDVTQTNLGLSEQNLLKIMNEVSIIYHSAATVKFDEPLKQSIGINITGTKNIIELCRKIPQLAALVHVSTAYANCDREEIDEHIYPIDNMNPEKLIELASWLDQDTLQELKKRLLDKRPNTYTYTKALAEWLLIKTAKDLPVVICRPSIVVASWKEPFTGWIDNVNGPTSIILVYGKGLIRSMFAESSYVGDLIPVDTVINLIITLGWFAHIYKNHKSGVNERAESCLTESSLSSSTSSLATTGIVINELGFEHEQKTFSIHEKNNNNNNNNSNSHYDNHNNFEKNGNHYYLNENNHQINNNNNNNNKQQQINANEHTKNNQSTILDDGYCSRSSFNPNSSSISSKQQLANINSKITSESNITNEGDDDVVKQTNQRVLEIVAQERRMAQEKHAAFEYKIKQFRHNIQKKLINKKLPDDLADIPVFHCTSGDKKPITWGQIQVFILKFCILYPSITIYRYPAGAFTNSKCFYNFCHIVRHYIPAYIVDFMTRLFGGKPILVKIYKKFDLAAKVLEAFTSKQWTFNTDNKTMLINELMSEEDKKLFNCDISPIDWPEFLEGYVLGVRKYLLKEPISNLKQARKNLNYVYYRNLSIKAIFFLSFMYYFFGSSSLNNIL